jgi:aminopeptidase N
MQEQLSALGCLIEFGKSNQSLHDFYKKWSSERLVMDKWFAIQVTRCDPKEVIQTVETLTGHPLFDMLNPNRFRAVFGSLISNTTAFHQQSGNGYSTLANWIIKLDPKNPQTAARVCTAFDTWSIYDPVRQKKIQDELKRILNQKNLSKDTSDIVTRILNL